MIAGQWVWIIGLLSPAIIGLPYELLALKQDFLPLLTDIARNYVRKHSGPAVVIGLVYGWLWGLLIGHLFL